LAALLPHIERPLLAFVRHLAATQLKNRSLADDILGETHLEAYFPHPAGDGFRSFDVRRCASDHVIENRS
jgi:hypothetical protein